MLLTLDRFNDISLKYCFEYTHRISAVVVYCTNNNKPVQSQQYLIKRCCTLDRFEYISLKYCFEYTLQLHL